MKTLLYIIGLIIVIAYLFFGFDDLVFELSYFIKRLFHFIKPSYIKIEDVNNVPPRLLAVIIANWHEDNVIGSVVDHLMATQIYPHSMFHLFLGVYPNDLATIQVVQDLAEKYENVHVVINVVPGPTCKADNINHALDEIHVYEQEHKIQFLSVTIHDSEDVLHPYELSLTNYLLNSYDVLQFPVFPIIHKPTLKNFFRQ